MSIRGPAKEAAKASDKVVDVEGKMIFNAYLYHFKSSRSEKAMNNVGMHGGDPIGILQQKEPISRPILCSPAKALECTMAKS